MSDETLLKPRQYKRDALGMFERPGATLKNTQKDKMKNKPENIKSGDLITNKSGRGGLRAGAGRPKGVPNKVTTKLKEAILQAAENAGGEQGIVGYLERLAVENSSAFAGLLGKVLPSTIAAESQDQHITKVTFERRIVYPKEQPKVIEADPVLKPGLLPDPKPQPLPIVNDRPLLQQITGDDDEEQDRGSARQGDF